MINLNGSSFLKVLVPFDLVYDIDFGLIKLIQNEFLDPNIFDTKLISNMTDDDIINYSMHRTDENPLYDLSVLPEENKGKELDELYEDFLNNYYKEILGLSNKTYLGSVLKTINTVQGIHVSLYYKSDYELEKLKELEIKDLIDSRTNLINLRFLKEFDAIYTKHPGEIPIKLEGKTIYCGNYGYMFITDENDEVVMRPELLLLSFNNVIKFTDLYMTEEFINKNFKVEDDEEEEFEDE